MTQNPWGDNSAGGWPGPIDPHKVWQDGFDSRAGEIHGYQERIINLCEAVKLAYRKHALDDSSVGWNELVDELVDTLCNELGSGGFCRWLEEVGADMPK